MGMCNMNAWLHAGVDVEVIAPPPAAAPRIAATEDVGAAPLFQLYADHVAMSPAAVTAGCEILQVWRDELHRVVQTFFKESKDSTHGVFVSSDLGRKADSAHALRSAGILSLTVIPLTCTARMSLRGL